MKRKITIKFILLTFLLVLRINKTIAQSEDLNENVLTENVSDESTLIESDFDNKAISKNSIYGSIGSLILSFSLTGFYERVLVQNGLNRNYSTFVRVGYGTFGSFLGGGEYIVAQYGLFTGSNKNHVEVSIGIMYGIGDTIYPSGKDHEKKYHIPICVIDHYFVCGN